MSAILELQLIYEALTAELHVLADTLPIFIFWGLLFAGGLFFMFCISLIVNMMRASLK